MPLMRCTKDGSLGWKWGRNGVCFIGPTAKDKALSVGRAIHAKRGDALSPDTRLMREILRQRRALNKGRKLRRPPRWAYPAKAETYYRRELLSLVRLMERTVNEIVIAHLPGIIEEANETRRRDAWPTDLRRLFEDTTLTVDQRNDIGAERLAAIVGGQTTTFNDTQWRKIVKSVMGVNVFTSEPWLNDLVGSWSEENVALIKSIKDDSLHDIEGMAQRGVREGVRHETIAKDIRRKFQTTKRRATLIARDQVSKLNGQLTEYRQTDLGVTHYVWRTSDDERVRMTHRENDDKRFAWSNPPPTGHPGSDIQCRCWAEPDFETMFEEIPETEVPLTTTKIGSVKVGDESVDTNGLPASIDMVRSREAGAFTWTQTSTLNRAWKRGGASYVGPGGRGGDLTKRQNLVAYLKARGNNAPLDMPVIRQTGPATIEFVKGKETFALLRDLGVTKIPVTLDGSDLTKFARTFGVTKEGSKIALSAKVKGTTGKAVAIKTRRRRAKTTKTETTIPVQTTTEFVPPTTLKEAKGQLESLVAHNDYIEIMDTPKAALIPRYHQPRSFKTANGLTVKEGVVIMPGDITIESATLVNRKVAELQRRCQALGIPRIRGVRFAKASSYRARMGDGLLDISSNLVNNATKPVDVSLITKLRLEQIQKYEKTISPESLAYLRTLPGMTEETIKQTVEHTKKQISFLKKQVADYEAGRHPDLLPLSSWKKGDSLKDRPLTSRSYWPKADSYNTTLEHEFGHHIHQYLDVKTQQDLMSPPLEKRLAELRRLHGANGSATRYASGEKAWDKAAEWFAENYALWQRGRKDLVDDVLKPILQEIDKRAGL